MIARRTGGALVASVLAVVIGACGGSPSGPGTVSPPPNGGGVQPPANQPPVIDSIELSSDRAEIDTEVTVTAHVRDAETPVEQLKYDWKADAGTFSGEGGSVKWRAPKEDKTPKDYTISLTVTETYGTADASGNRPQNIVSGTSPEIRVHNSPKELGDLSIAFLTDFANSSIPSSVCLRDFSDSCGGKAEEKGDIDWNREHVNITGSSLRLTNVRVASGGLSADMTVACSFTSVIIKCDPNDPNPCKVGEQGKVEGVCSLTGKYEQRRWWLCDSHFSGKNVPLMFRSFFRHE